MGLAEDIGKIRLSMILIQEGFAKELGVSFKTVNRWETDKVKPSIKAVKRIDEFWKRHNIDFDASKIITEKF